MVPLIAIPAVLLLAVLLVLRPRKGGKDAPPMITATSAVPIFGPVLEFVKNPMAMVKRCYKDYGPVYTVPVSEIFCFKETCSSRRCL